MNPHLQRIAFVDIETTDLVKLKLFNPTREDLTPWAEICEIGIVVATPELEVVDEFEAKAKLQFPDRMDPRAQAVNGYNGERLGTLSRYHRYPRGLCSPYGKLWWLPLCFTKSNL